MYANTSMLHDICRPHPPSLSTLNFSLNRGQLLLSTESNGASFRAILMDFIFVLTTWSSSHPCRPPHIVNALCPTISTRSMAILSSLTCAHPLRSSTHSVLVSPHILVTPSQRCSHLHLLLSHFDRLPVNLD